MLGVAQLSFWFLHADEFCRKAHETDNPARAGVLSGIMGTAAGIGGPPLAMLYAGRGGAQLRANLAALFLLGKALSLTALAAAGRVAIADLLLAAVLGIPAATGFAASRLLAPRFDGRWLRSGVLTVVVVSGMLLMTRAVLDVVAAP